MSAPSSARPRQVAALPAGRVTVLLVVGLAGGLLSGCDGGSAARSAAGTSATRTATPTGPVCPVGSWSIPAREEFAQMGLGALTRGTVAATGGTIRIRFATDHTYTFSYERVALDLGRGAGTATVSGPVQGAWKVDGDRLTTTVTSSRVTANVKVGGAVVPPTAGLNKALSSGLPTTVRVRCGSGRLTTTITSGAAAGREVTFSAG